MVYVGDIGPALKQRRAISKHRDEVSIPELGLGGVEPPPPPHSV